MLLSIKNLIFCDLFYPSPFPVDFFLTLTFQMWHSSSWNLDCFIHYIIFSAEKNPWNNAVTQTIFIKSKTMSLQVSENMCFIITRWLFKLSLESRFKIVCPWNLRAFPSFSFFPWHPLLLIKTKCYKETKTKHQNLKSLTFISLCKIFFSLESFRIFLSLFAPIQKILEVFHKLSDDIWWVLIIYSNK